MLTAFAITGQSRPSDQVVTDVTAGRDNPCKFFRASRRKFFVIRAMALSLDGDQLAVADGRNRSPTRQPNPQWLAALATALFLPGEGQPRQGQVPSSGRAWPPSPVPDTRSRRRLGSPFFIQIIGFENRIQQFARNGHSASLATKHNLLPWSTGSLINSSNVAMICRVLGRGFWPSSRSDFADVLAFFERTLCG